MSPSSAFSDTPPLSNRIVEEDLQAIVAAPLPWSKLAGKTVLISGAGGFLPAYLVQTLLSLRPKQSPKFYGSDPVGTLEANILGTHHLLSLEKKHEVESFLFFSSREWETR